MFSYTNHTSLSSEVSAFRLFLARTSVFEVATLFIAISLFWGSFRAIYLLYFHPLASFPGPRRAALSTWWLYSQSKSGRAEEIFEELHKKYNTRALRIAPNEIHITDSALYHTIYSQRHTFTKQAHFYSAFMKPYSVFVETDVELHRQRRKQLSNFFSKMSIRSIEGILLSKVATLCKRISETRFNGPVNFYQTFRKHLHNAPFLETFDLAANSFWDIEHFSILRVIISSVPSAVAGKLSRSAARLQGLLLAVADTVTKFRRLKSSGKSFDHVVVFDKLSDLDDVRLQGEAADILVAGSDTTATTLAVAIEQIIERPAVYTRLRKELRDAGFLRERDYELQKLEQLPYLSSCVKEALRYAMAVPGRLPRIVPEPGMGAEALVVDGKHIPPGACVSISAYSVHFDESIWGADARSFIPERWLTDDGKHLEKYLVTFSKGARQCLGINLAYAEATLTLAMVVNRFRFTADKTLKESDLKRVDNFTMGYEGTGIRAEVHEDYQKA
ncbi:Cytochrome p450 [Colletotrichum higginsianum IMI 349063]|uniref:Cytochrome p450 n=3 Tax=Colletotrichum higginsianum (strain IMI 349063) TaxID=759273 RepID=A0A1B7Y6J3_COLHI|nr:Cytochrome p450 [Colletotrichum higginsianum IMI 349063]OBR07631.1 Cytochrome p450 [Colletotrichum higginsianum IMI 349063]